MPEDAIVPGLSAPHAIDMRIKVPVRDTAADPPVGIPEDYRRYEDVYGVTELLNLTVSELIAEMDAHGVSGSVLQAEHEWGEDAEYNDRVAALLRAHPQHFACGFAAVDPREPMAAVRELDRAYHELGLRGAIFEPGFLKIPPTDARCYPIYAKCVELGIPLGLHTGVNFSSSGPIENGHPLLVDRVACDFPELTIICHHGGWPWPHEAVAVAWKHTNVYLEFGAVAPRYMADGGGWGDTVRFMDTVVRKRVLFGSNWPMLRYGRALEEVPQLGLREEALEDYLHGNAARLLERILNR
jgi:predicted TIM-barrel fold metal-dependent hydrolase